MDAKNLVATSITFPCGLEISNRLIKAAMAEHLSVKGRPELGLVRLYTQWGNGGWGAVMTGNVMIDERYLGASGDATILQSRDKASATDATIKAWRAIAESIKANGSAALMQINHPGRQSPVGAGSRNFLTKNLAPSAVPLNFGSGFFTKSIIKLLYGTPAELRTDQIQDIISSFVSAAVIAHAAGFDGVEIHAAHGYLLSDFLSPKVNQRSDTWGGTAIKRAFIIVQIIRGIRKALGKSFCIGVKMNSADQQNEASLEAVLEQVSSLAAEEIDFLEISGGTYEDPQMVNGNPDKSERTAQREAYFLEFATEVRKQHPNLHLMLTGGFRTRSAMNSALESQACSIIGIARPAAVAPDFPKSVIGITSKQRMDDGEAGLQLAKIAEPWFAKLLPNQQLRRALRGGAETQYYCDQMKKSVRSEITLKA